MYVMYDNIIACYQFLITSCRIMVCNMNNILLYLYKTVHCIRYDSNLWGKIFLVRVCHLTYIIILYNTEFKYALFFIPTYCNDYLLNTNF